MQRVETYYGIDTRLKLDRDSVVTRQTLRVAEWHLYGSSRLGIYKTQDTLRTVDLSLVYKPSDVNIAPTQTHTKKEFYSFDSTYTHHRGDKLYEGSNHLGNVLATFSDKRLATCTEGQVHYQADVRSVTDYAAFHALLDDRQWYSSTDSTFYRYGGSNGQEKDDEIYGTGNSYSAEFWQYDPRLGRRWNVDPVVKSDQSSYAAFVNSPLWLVDPVGADSIIVHDDGTIKNVFKTDGIYRVFSTTGKEYDLSNDNDFYQKQIDQLLGGKDNESRYFREYTSEDILFYKLSNEKILEYMKEADVMEFQVLWQLSKDMSWLGGAGYQGMRYAKGILAGHSEFDFMPKLFYDYNLHLRITEDGVLRFKPEDGTGPFFLMGNSNKLYNLYDAGNWLTGKAFQLSFFSWEELEVGSNLNEWYNVGDSPADQKALKEGFDYKLNFGIFINK